jgi:hypothetical protein
VYFYCILEKNTNRKHITGAPFLMPVVHPIRGACSRAPLIINTSGLICVAHQGCATEAQNGAPQIRVSLVVRAPEAGSSRSPPTQPPQRARGGVTGSELGAPDPAQEVGLFDEVQPDTALATILHGCRRGRRSTRRPAPPKDAD